MQKTQAQQIKFLITTLALFILPLAFFQNCAESDKISELKSVGLGTQTGEISSGFSITNQPSGEQVILLGESTQLSVGVLSSEALQFQWYKDDSPIAGAQSHTLSLNNLLVSDAGEYYVQISSATKMVKSNVTKIIVTSSQSGNYVSNQPTPIDIAMNQTGQLSSTVAGKSPNYVVWYKDGELISENNPYFQYIYSGSGNTYRLKILAISTNIQGSYRVDYVYDNETISSQTALVKIKPLVGIKLQDGSFARIWVQPSHETENLKAYCLSTASTETVASYTVSSSTFSQYVAYDGNIDGQGTFRIFNAGMSNTQFYDDITCGTN